MNINLVVGVIKLVTALYISLHMHEIIKAALLQIKKAGNWYVTKTNQTFEIKGGSAVKRVSESTNKPDLHGPRSTDHA